MSTIHRLWHRFVLRSPQCVTSWPCSALWEGIPFIETDGHAHYYSWSEVKAHRHGGPPPTCNGCGQVAS